MITASNLGLRRGGRVLLADASFTLHDGWKVGVVGRNGTGKSSLFAALRGELGADTGSVSSIAGYEVASVAQQMPHSLATAIDYALDGDGEWRELQARLVTAEATGDAHQLGAIHERLAQIDGYATHARAARLLKGLGFSDEQQAQSVNALSGGWRIRLNLAQALMCRSTLLLLDEPTNHLDLDAVLWLQGYLNRYPGTLLVISHDRDFLDAVTDHTLYLASAHVTLYSGNYSQFERLHAERLALQQNLYDKQQREIAHLEQFITRFRAKATKATQAQSRIRTLERMEKVAAVHVESPFFFSFPEPDRLPSPLLRLDDVAAGYADTVILKKLRLSILPGERIGVLGANGAGKSTLIQTFAGTLQPLAGSAQRHRHLRVGYFAQSTAASLDAKASPLLHLRRLSPKITDQSLRDYLGGFDFHGNRVLEPVSTFSGGEKARLALALVAWQKPNLLLLDEPTNHLDLDMRHALETALLDYPGAVVLVSHDRHLVDSICETLWWVHAGACRAFDGDIDDYARALLGGRKAAPAQTPQSAAPTKADENRELGAGSDRRDRAQQRRLTKPLRDELKTVEKRMERHRRKLAELDAKMAEPAFYEDSFAAAKAAQEHGQISASLAGDEEQWLDLSEQLEAAQS